MENIKYRVLKVFLQTLKVLSIMFICFCMMVHDVDDGYEWVLLLLFFVIVPLVAGLGYTAHLALERLEEIYG